MGVRSTAAAATIPPGSRAATPARGRALQDFMPTKKGIGSGCNCRSFPGRERVTMRAVRFDQYGGVEVLERRRGARTPSPATGRCSSRSRPTSINPGEAKIRDGLARRDVADHVPLRRGLRSRGHRQAQVGAGVTGIALRRRGLRLDSTTAPVHAELVVCRRAAISTPSRSSSTGRSPARCIVAGATGWAAGARGPAQ